MTRPSRRCPQCHDAIRREQAPVYDGLEYCCEDCALNAYLAENDPERTHVHRVRDARGSSRRRRHRGQGDRGVAP